MSNPLADMQKPDVFFCIGTNMTECHPVAATGIKKALGKGARMIVADPRRIRLAELAVVIFAPGPQGAVRFEGDRVRPARGDGRPVGR